MSVEYPQSTSTFKISLSREPEPNSSTLPTARLVTPRRWDIALKARYFRHLRHGGDEEAERLYVWHIEQRSGHRMQQGLPTDLWKRSIDDYVSSSRILFASMAKDGFDPRFPVPVDPIERILGGAHRVACAIALDIKTVPVSHQPQYVWAPHWGEQWFRDHGMRLPEIERLRQDVDALMTMR